MKKSNIAKWHLEMKMEEITVFYHIIQIKFLFYSDNKM